MQKIEVERIEQIKKLKPKTSELLKIWHSKAKNN